MTKEEKLAQAKKTESKFKKVVSRLKDLSGENYTAIESVVAEISELGQGLISDYTNEVEYHSETTSESIKRKEKIAKLESEQSELSAELKKIEDYKGEIEQRDTKIGSLESRLKEYDTEVISKYKDRHEKFKISDSEHKKYFDLPDDIENLTVEQARKNNSELDKLIELGVFEKNTTDSGTPRTSPFEKDFDLKKIYSNS